MTRTLLPCGERAVLVEVDGIGDVLALTAAVRAAAAAGAEGLRQVEEIVPAATTVLVVIREGGDLDGLRAALAALDVAAAPEPPAGEVVQIRVRYDGPDLSEVARQTGLSRSAVVAAHCGSDWQVAFCGFAPGFAYLVGGDPRLRVRRRPDPRTRVPAGSVGLGGEFSAVYPRPSPGGWQLIGSTSALMFDVDRDPPALLVPGMRVRFVEAAGESG